MRLHVHIHNEPINSEQIAVIDEPFEPLAVAIDHQEPVAQHAIIRVVPGLAANLVAVDDSLYGGGEGYELICRLDEGLVRHGLNSFSCFSRIRRSMRARWLISSLLASSASMVLLFIDNLKLVGLFMDVIVAQFALQGKSGNREKNYGLSV